MGKSTEPSTPGAVILQTVDSLCGAIEAMYTYDQVVVESQAVGTLLFVEEDAQLTHSLVSADLQPVIFALGVLVFAAAFIVVLVTSLPAAAVMRGKAGY